MNELENALKCVFKDNLGVKPKEKVLVVIDKNKRKLGEKFLDIGKGFTHSIDLIEIPVGKVHGEEPPRGISERMLHYDVELLITTKSLTHTKARRDACKNGARIATMPDADEDMLKRALDVDYKKMHERIARMCDLFDDGNDVRVTSGNGTDLEFSVRGRKSHGRTSGIFLEKGKYGNLPDGESFIAPVEGSARGFFVIDGSIGGIGLVDNPVKVVVEDGYAKEIIGGSSADSLRAQLDMVGKKGRNIAEFGLGMNDKARITGNMLEDEKVMGTCHIALGNNSGFGGRVTVELHIDALIKSPSVFVDNKIIMKEGKIV